jgi:hypothetical protein
MEYPLQFCLLVCCLIIHPSSSILQLSHHIPGVVPKKGIISKDLRLQLSSFTLKLNVTGSATGSLVGGMTISSLREYEQCQLLDFVRLQLCLHYRLLNFGGQLFSQG